MNLVGIDQTAWCKTYPALAANAALIFFVLIKRPVLRTYLLIFAATTAADILVAGKIIPIANAQLQTSVEYIFVLIGDLRFIFLIAFFIYARKKMGDLENFKADASVWKPALVFMMFASLIVQAIDYAKPGLFLAGGELTAGPRRRFLAYELISLTLTFLWIYAVMPQKAVAERAAKFLRRVSIPVFAYYGLWSLADILILNGIDAGYALRIVPNLVYYSAFLWWVFLFSR